MLPNWKIAPEWANFAAQDSDGSWRWFELEPKFATVGFWSRNTYDIPGQIEKYKPFEYSAISLFKRPA
jgi:hypothetical protein